MISLLPSYFTHSKKLLSKTDCKKHKYYQAVIISSNSNPLGDLLISNVISNILWTNNILLL